MALTRPSPELHAYTEQAPRYDDVLQPVELEYGMVLTIEGEADQSLLLVQKGEVALWRAGVEIGTAGPREIIGAAEVFGRAQRALHSRVVHPGRALLIERADIDRLDVDDRARVDLERRVLLQLAQRLTSWSVRIGELSWGTEAEVDLPRRGGASPWTRWRGWGADARGALARLPWLDALEPAAREPLVRVARAHTFGAGRLLQRAGQVDGPVWIIAEGQGELMVSTERDRGATVGLLRPGAVVGGAGAVLGTGCAVSARATTPVVALALPRQHLAGLAEAATPLGSALRRMLAAAMGQRSLTTSLALAALERQFRTEVARQLHTTHDGDNEESLSTKPLWT